MYASEGLYFLSRVRSRDNEIAYDMVVQRLSDLIVHEGDPDRLPPLGELRPFKEEKNAFQPVVAAGAQGIATTTRGGPNAAHFVYVAGRNSELGSVRQKVDCYGEEGNEWRPFHPELEKPVWLIGARNQCRYLPTPVRYACTVPGRSG